jgi:hypothetical protein
VVIIRVAVISQPGCVCLGNTSRNVRAAVTAGNLNGYMTVLTYAQYNRLRIAERQ